MKQPPNRPQKKKLQTVRKEAEKRKTKPGSKKIWLVLLLPALAVLITFFAYKPSLSNGFTNWDDPTYVLENKELKQFTPETIKYFFSHASALNYHPLTMISLSLDYYFTVKSEKHAEPPAEIDATVFHTTNLILHLLNVILVFVFIYILSGKRISVAFITALLFGIHPMHVESVAWISERKDVLYAFFFMGGLIFYLLYRKSSKWIYYLITILLFFLSLLSKPAAVIFPLILLAIDYYVKRKIGLKMILEKIPYFLLAILFGIITFVIQSKVAVADFQVFTIFQRLMFATYGFIMYLYKCLLPYNLSAFYPYPHLDSSGNIPAIFYLSPILVLFIIGIVLFTIKYNRLISFSVLFYFITIMLVLQFISVGSALLSDRYTYVPFIGLFFMIGTYFDVVYTQKFKIFSVLKYLFLLALIAYTSIMVTMTYARTQVWKDTITLWTDELKKYPDVEVAYKNRGNYYAQNHQNDLALQDYMVLLQMKTKDPKIYSNLGNIYGLRGEFDKSEEAYNQSLKLDSNAYDSYLNRGITYARAGKYDLAVRDFNKALMLNPGSVDVNTAKAYSLLEKGELDNANDLYSMLIKLDPRNDDLYCKRGLCKYRQNKLDEALNDFLQCIHLNPDNSVAYFNSSVIYNTYKDYKNAYLYASKAKAKGFAVDQAYYEGLSKKQ
jgi:tetratricopeptide (TPR) repeat protein